MSAKTSKSTERLPKGLAHVVTVGTTPPGAGTDVVEAIIGDLRGATPCKVVVIATEDSRENAQRILKGLGLRGAKGRIRLIDSAQSLDDAYRATNEELLALLGEGIAPSDIILHYTGGTKVMSAGAVLASVNQGIQSLRYLFSQGWNKPSLPVITPTSAVLVDKQVHLALTLLRELRFRSARDVLSNLDHDTMNAADIERCKLISELSLAYSEWDNFRISGFLQRYTPIHDKLAGDQLLGDFRLGDKALSNLKRLAIDLESEGIYPEDLLVDLMNNAYRRLAERHNDDAMTRLHRAAELFAQRILLEEHRIDSADVEIRKVPPRYRTAFEAERRLEDAKIKLGMRRSYELLEILGSDVGQAYRESESLRAALHERRHLVLAHGTRSATAALAMEFARQIESVLLLRVKNLARRLNDMQFPWIDNGEILTQLQRTPTGEDTVLVSKSPSRSARRRANRRKNTTSKQ